MQPELHQKIIHRHLVVEEDLAQFKFENVHRVCSTFALTREVEWTTRQYITQIKTDEEEGIGTMVELYHENVALLGEELVVFTEVDSFDHHELICSFEVKVGKRLIASGRTGQKLLPKSVIERKIKEQDSGD
jgi:fluoroacetyl-CoA thioesterase